MALLFLEGFTRHERHEATLLLTDAVSRAGWVLDCTQHSNKAVTLRFEVEPHRVSVLAGQHAGRPQECPTCQAPPQPLARTRWAGQSAGN